MNCTITGLSIYPVKACRAVDLEAAEVSVSGLQGDRVLMVVADGAMLNQKRSARLATVTASPRADGTLMLSAADAGEFVHTPRSDGPRIAVNYYADRLELVDQGDALAEWISAAIGREARVVALPAPYARHIPLDEFAVISGNPQAGFPDVAPVLLTNEASLEDLNDRLAEPIPMERFRPNIVVRGLPAYAEDAIAELRGPDVALRRVTGCERCAVTATDQRTGARGQEPLATLKGYRKLGAGYAGGIVFGAYMTFASPGSITIGDEFEVMTQ